MNPNDESSAYPEGSEKPGERAENHAKSILLVTLGVIILVALVFITMKNVTDSTPVTDEDILPEKAAESGQLAPDQKESRSAIIGGILTNNPEQLQNLLLEDIQSGVNNKFTKTHAYFVTHRFYDNGGDIYEIYNYVNSHPELAFLKEAESIYPEYFDLIAKGQLPKTFTDRGNMANMAYAEILDKKGYGDTALLGTIANQYAKIALFSKIYATKDAARADMFNNLADQLLVKSQAYALKMRPRVLAVVDGSADTTSYTPHEALVGLNQYASSLRYLTAHNIILTGVDHDKESADIFDYTARLARSQFIELINFTSLINASTLVIAGNRDTMAINEALESIINHNTAERKPFKNGALDRIINARTEVVRPDLIIRELDVYSKSNIVGLAVLSPDFREWLMKNGWQEEDFEIEVFLLDLQGQ